MSDAKSYIQKNAVDVIEKFGGIRPMANKLGIAATTIQGWKKRGVIPPTRIEDIIKAANENNISFNGLGQNSEVETKKEDVVDISSHQKTEKAKVSSPLSSANSNLANDTLSEDDVEEEKSMPAKPVTSEVQSKKEELPKVEIKKVMPPPASPEQAKVKFGTWLTVALFVISFVTILAIIVPIHQQAQENKEQLIEIQKSIQGMDPDQQKTLSEQIGEYIPGDLDEQLEAFRQQTGELSSQVGELAQQTTELASQIIPEEERLKWQQRVTELEGQLGDLFSATEIQGIMNRFQYLNETTEGQSQLDDATGQLHGIVDSLDGRLDLLDEALVLARENSTALGETFEGLPDKDLKAGALLLALTQFRDSLNRGNTPFEEDLELLNSFVGEEDAELKESLDKLAPQAESGVLTLSGLSDEFRGLTGEIVVSSLKNEEVSIVDQAGARLSKVLQIKKDGEPMIGTDTQIQLQKTQELIDQGDMNGALFNLQQLEGDAASMAQPFMQKLEATIAAANVQNAITAILQETGFKPKPLNLNNVSSGQ